MRTLHICFVSQEYPPETGWGGVASYTYDVAHALAKAGHRVTVVSRALDQEKVTCDRGVEVHRIVPSPPWSNMTVLWRLDRFWPDFAWAAMRRVRAIHGSFPIDVIEAAEVGANGLFASWLRPRPRLIVRLHIGWIFVDRQNGVPATRKQRARYFFEKRVIAKADVITAPCQAMVDLTRTWVTVPSTKTFVIPNPVNTATFCPTAVAEEPEVLFVGRLERRKGISTLAEALPQVLRRCADVRFRLVGSDGIDPVTHRSWRAILTEPLSSSERNRVVFEHVSRSELVQRYRRAAICVLPSPWENFPYALLEAMACGKPVVATRVGGIPELVEHGSTGLLVPPENASLLTDAICDLLAEPGRRAEMGLRGRIRVEEEFSLERIVPKMLQLYCRDLAT